MITLLRCNKPDTKSILFAVLLAILLPMLSGCLVDDDKDLKTLIERDPNNGSTPRMIVSGDFLEYAVFGRQTIAAGDTKTVSGTLEISWVEDLIPEHFGGTEKISVLKETTVFTLGSTTYEAQRYIKQLENGRIELHAFDSPNPNDYFRVGPLNNDLGDISPITILHSEVKSNGEIDTLSYKIAEGCESGISCTDKLLDVIETVKYIGDQIIQTDVGKFNTLRLDNNGSFASAVTNIATLFDFRGACQFTKATFGGYYNIFPEVGIVRFEQDCSDLSSGGFHITATLTHTNIAIPRP